MSGEGFGFKISIDTAQAKQDLKSLEQSVIELNSFMVKVGEGGKVLQIEGIRQKFKSETDGAISALKELEAEIKALESAQNRLKGGGAANLSNEGAARRVAEARGLQRFPGTDRLVVNGDALRTALKGANDEAANLLNDLRNISAEMAKSIQGIVSPEQLARANALKQLTEQRLSMQQQAAQIVGGQGATQALEQRRNALLSNLAELEAQRAQIEAHLQSGMERKQSGEVDQMVRARREEADALRAQAAALARIKALTSSLGAKVGKAQAGVFAAPETLQEVQTLRTALESIKGVAAEDTAELSRLRAELEKFAEASSAVERARIQKQKGQQHIDARAKATGVLPQLQEINAAIARTTAAFEGMFGAGAMGRLFPGLDKDILELKEIEILLASEEAKGKELEAIYARQAELVARVKQTLAGASTLPAGTKARSPEEMRQLMMAQMPLLERTFTSVFSDMQRRFIATFQFAISGALIFGTQRLVREFIQTAIEVERAFADIESALEFDISSTRGTAEFAREVEGVRREVLALANTFNTLPTDANKSAFVMVSRFKDIDNAMLAVRAHLLAVKVSTIDQTEVLRALTAVAEGFASSILTVNNGLSIEEKLLRKEAASATLYGKALDLAVMIQQKFGIEVEDTLEGTARSTEVFKQMGFTMEETAAIVSATSRELGQTGQQTAERLNRSLGQLTDPKIRQQLLDLAAGSKEFSLTYADFTSGATAWKKITQQFDRLSISSPAVARSILQIVGQRRELEAVAAALGTSDLQREIAASAAASTGAAEKRFSYLSQTISEMIESIKTGFQELAQNFEKLGGISALKLLIAGVDQLAASVNRVLKLLIDLKDFLDNIIPGFKLGSIIVQFTALSLSVLSVIRVVSALQVAFENLAVSKMGMATADLASGFAAGFTSLAATTQLGKAAGVPFPMFQASLIHASKGLKTFGKAIYGAIGPWGLLAVAATVAAVSIKALYDETNALKESFTTGTAAIREAAADARAESIRLGESTSEAQARLLQAQLDAAIAQQRSAPGGSPSNWRAIGGALKDIFLGIPSTILGGDRKPETFRTVRARLDPSIEKGSREFFQDLIDELNKNILAMQAKELSVSAVKMDDIDLSGMATEGFLGRIAGAFNIKLSDVVFAKIREANDASAEGDIASAYALLAEGDAIRIRILEFLGLIDQEFTDSAKELNQKLSHLDTKVALGEITQLQSAIRAQGIADKLQGVADAAKTAASRGMQIPADELLQLQQDADDALLAAISRRATALQNDIDSIRTGTLGQEEALRQELEMINSYLEQETQHSQKRDEFARRKVEIEDELIKLTLARAEKEARNNVAAARTMDAAIAANAILIQVLENNAYVQRQILGNAGAADDIEAQIETIRLANAKSIADMAKRSAMARQRLSGPILNTMNGIKAQIIGVKSEMASGFLSEAEMLEAQVTLQELQAQLAQAELDRVFALEKAKVSANDAMRANQLELTRLNRLLALTARLFGVQSAEWAQVKQSIVNMKAALMDQALELEDINRRLGSDVTDTFEQAQLKLVEIAQKLKVPGLGDLEKARLELEQKNAEMAAIREFYNDRLFTLKFDFDRGAISKGQYIAALQKFLSELDLSTKQGKELWEQINGLIEGMTSDLSDMQFNIPGQIRLPTLFEVRRSLAADALGVNYQDNRQQDIRIYVASDVDVAKVADAVNEGLGAQAATASARYAPGSSTLTLGV